ncbi:MAG: glycosyltransferase [Bacteroidota bacterium]
MLTVAHLVNPFLFGHGSWIYNQIRFGKNCRHIVFTDRRENAELFPFDAVFSKGDYSISRLSRLGTHVYNRYFKTDFVWEKMARAENVDIIHSHFGTMGVSKISLSKRLDVSHVVSFYGYDYGGILDSNSELKDEYHRLFQTVAGIFVEGPYARARLTSLGADPKKVFISHLGTDLGSILMKPRVYENRDAFKILIVAAFIEKKGILVALRAIADLLKSGATRITVTLVGDAVPTRGNESALIKNEILKFIDMSPLRHAVTLTGTLPYGDVIKLAYSHHLLMQTSIHARDGDCEGGFPVIITDMMGTGLPVLGSSHCDIPEIIKNNQNGFVAEEGSVEDTTRLLEVIMSNYNSYSRQWYEYNRKFLIENFDARICAEQREILYAKLLPHNH